MVIRIYLLGAMIFLVSSCSNVYYNTAENIRDEKQAMALIKGLKSGTLIVQIPCEKQKLHVMKNLANKEKDPEKKAELQQNYEDQKDYLKMIQSAMIQAANHQYLFSNYYFLPDTSVVAFKKGERDNIFINDEFEYIPKVNIDDNSTILFLRGERQYDYLYVYKPDATYPPEPFPYYSSVKNPFKKARHSYKRDNARLMDWKKLFYEAFAHMNQNFNNFYDKHF